MTRKNRPYRHSVEVPCAQCGTVKKQFQADIDNGGGKYCSTACQAEGQSRHAEILAAAPGTIREIAARLGSDEYTICHPIRRLCRAGRMHASGLVVAGEQTARSHFLVVFSAGPGEDPDVPTSAREALPYFLDQMIVAAMPGTTRAIAKATGITERTVASRIVHLRAAKKCHTGRWKRSKGKGYPAAVHTAGEGVDAPMIAPLTRQERFANWMKRLRRTGNIEQHLAHRREVAAYKKLRTTTGDPLLNALFGSPAQRKQRQESA